MTVSIIESYDNIINVEDIKYTIEVESPYYLEVIEDGKVVHTIVIQSEYTIGESEGIQRLDVASNTIEYIENVLPGPPGPEGPVGPPGTEVSQNVFGPILTGTTEIVDTISIVNYSAVYWIVVIKDLISNKYMHFQIHAAKSPSQPDPKYARSVLLADKLPVTEAVTVTGTNMILSFTNNNVNPVYVSYIRSRVL